MLHLIWYCSTSWVSNIGDLVLLLIFWLRIIMCGWLWVITSNFLKIKNGWAVVVKYATTVVYVGTHCFPQFLENSRSHSNAYNNVISSHLLNGKGIVDSTENLPGITDGHQNYEKCEYSDRCRRKEPENEKQSWRFLKLPICDWILGFLKSSAVVFLFRITFQSPGLL